MDSWGRKVALLSLAGMLVMGLVALAWAMGSGSSEAQSNTVHNCPLQGRWAIAVWSGEDGTDIDQALATCGAGTVAAAYYLDPQTQGWLRWFAGQPEISNLTALSNMQGVLALGAAVASGAGPTPTPNTSGEPEWRLVVDGLVQSPLNLTFEDLLAMPTSSVYAELHCVAGPAAVLAEGDWTGVRLGFLLEEAGVSPQAVKVAFYADDGFTTDLTVTTAARDDIILAYERDGEPLAEKLRLVVPGKWGYKWIREVTHIELVDYDFKGTYESSGYSDDADISSNP